MQTTFVRIKSFTLVIMLILSDLVETVLNETVEIKREVQNPYLGAFESSITIAKRLTNYNKTNGYGTEAQDNDQTSYLLAEEILNYSAVEMSFEKAQKTIKTINVSSSYNFPILLSKL